MPLRPDALTNQATQLLLARRWEASLREPFDYRQLFDALLSQEAVEVADKPVMPDTATAPAFDPIASARWLDDFRQMVQQRHCSFAIEESDRGHVLQPWNLVVAAGSLPAAGAGIAEDEDLIRQLRQAQAESSGGPRRKALPPVQSHKALSVYGGVTLLIPSPSDR